MDSRKDMTKRLIADGFKALMLRYPFEKISIMMITNEAGIRRRRFIITFRTSTTCSRGSWKRT